MKDYKILNLNDSKEWNLYLKKLKSSNIDIYYTPEYYSLYQNYGDGIAECFVFEDGNQIALYPYLINSINKLGYKLDEEYFDIQGAYGYNGVITNSIDESFKKDFFVMLNQYCIRRKIVAEFTRFHPLIKNEKFTDSGYTVLKDRITANIILDRESDSIFSTFQTSTKKQIKRAINRHGIKLLVIKQDEKYVEPFYEIYVDSLNRIKSESYLYFNKQYFKELMMLNGVYFLFAIHNNIPVSAIVVMHNGLYLSGHLGGTKTEYMHLSLFSYLYYEMVKLGRNLNCNFLQLGGGLTNSIEDNLLRFKLNFTNTIEDFYIGKRIYNDVIYKQILSQFKLKYPDLYFRNKHKLLGYREI